MKVSTQIGRGPDPKEIIVRAQDLERVGVDGLWTGEAYSADGVSLMGFLAAVTDHVEIGSSILPLYTRTPTLLAMTAVGIDALSQGRCILGIGASGPQVIEGFHGVAYDAPVGRTAEIIEICRQVWRREAVSFSGASYTVPLPPDRGTGLAKPIKLVDHPVRERIPIYVAALGPRNVALAAEMAEGWLPLHFWPERAKEVWGDGLASGSARRSPDLPPLEIVAGGAFALGDGIEHLRDKARPMLALYFGGMGARSKNFYNELLRRYGYEKEAELIQDLYLSGQRKEAAAAVPAELVDATSLIGPPGWVKERVEAFREAGVTNLLVQASGPNPLRDLEQLRSWLT